MAEDRTLNGVNDSRDCLLLVWMWGSAAEMGLLQSSTGVHRCNIQNLSFEVKLFAAKDWQIGPTKLALKKHVIFKLQDELKPV